MESGLDIAIDLTPVIGDLRDAPQLYEELKGLTEQLESIGQQSAEIQCEEKKKKCRDVLNDRTDDLGAGSLTGGLPSWWPF